MSFSWAFFFCIIEKGENFQPDHAALLSILRNEGVGVTGPAPTTPQSKPYNYLVSWIHSGAFFIMLFFVCLFLMPIVAAGKHFFKGVQWSCVQPQRVSVMTSRQKAGAPAGQCKMENTACAWHIHVNIVKDLFYSRWPSSPFEILYKYISLYVCVLSPCVKSPIKMPQLWVSLTGSQFYSN